jgi:hypothetical protein
VIKLLATWLLATLLATLLARLLATLGRGGGTVASSKAT